MSASIDEVRQTLVQVLQHRLDPEKGPDNMSTQDRRKLSAEFSRELGALLQAGGEPFDALRTASKHLEVEGPADVLARATLALASDFEAANPGVSVHRDGMALTRIMEALIKASAELRTMPATEINLPFLAVTSAAGPVHFQRDLTRAELDTLSVRESIKAQAAGASPPLSPYDSLAKVEPKKRWWWPFGE